MNVSTIQNWLQEVRTRPLELVLGACIFATAATGGAIQDVASTSLAVMFLTCLLYIRSWPSWWRRLESREHWLLLGLAVFMLSGLLSSINAEDSREFIRHMGRYLRFLLIVPVYLLLSRADLKLYRYLLAGAIVGGPLYMVFTLISVIEKPDLPASWQYHHIVFGNAAMLNAMFLAAVLVVGKYRLSLKVLITVAMLCALYASIMSQARGAWIALPACLATLLFVVVRSGEIKIRTLLATLLLAAVVVAVSPLTGLIEKRYQEAVHEIERFTSGEQFATSVGGRLAMWHVAFNVWQEHPLIGTGLGDYDEELRHYQQQGLYSSIEVHTNTHNIYLQSLATTGIIGFIALCAGLFVLPLRLFMLGGHEQLRTARVGGLITLVAFAVFGLTESWILRAPVLSLYLVYLVTLANTFARNAQGAD